MKAFILIITFISSIYAFNFNETLLKMHATLVPKIYLMDYDFKKKSINKTITIAIFHERGEYKSAQFLKKQILRKYKNGIKSYSMNVKLVTYGSLKQVEANIYYIFPTTRQNTLKAVSQAKQAEAITFAYSKEDLKYGVMISLDVAKKTKPLLNLQAIKQNNISLRPILIDISSIYDNQIKSLLNSIIIRKQFYYMT